MKVQMMVLISFQFMMHVIGNGEYARDMKISEEEAGSQGENINSEGVLLFV